MFHETRADEDLLLELLNTTPTISGLASDVLAEDGSGRTWLRERGGRGTRLELARITAARHAIQRVVRGEAGPAELAPYLDTVRSNPAIRDGAVSWTFEADADMLLAARCVLTWDALEKKRPGGLRSCANEDCSLFLIDRSNGNRAQWCSMAVCGNRMKARRHYRQSRSEAAPVSG